MELKLSNNAFRFFVFVSINRTFMELKLLDLAADLQHVVPYQSNLYGIETAPNASSCSQRPFVSIEPLWN